MTTVLRAPYVVPLVDASPAPVEIRRAALAGLSAPQPTLPCSLFYDEAGAALFEQICELPEYYPTRTEIGILRQNLDDIGSCIGVNARVIELGSGGALKTRILLSRIHAAEYIPIDISRAQLLDTGARIASEFPRTRVRPVCADYTRPLHVPPRGPGVARSVVFFPGSTIGNFEPDAAERFLHSLAHVAGAGGGLLIGVDLQKDRARLEAAYDDAAGVTAKFNLNMLTRLNREAGADFDVGAFRHRAIYNDGHHRIEMHLISRREQRVTFAGIDGAAEAVVPFERGTTIVTEHSYKYSIDGFAALARRAGWRCERTWVDSERLFSVHWCVAQR